MVEETIEKSYDFLEIDDGAKIGKSIENVTTSVPVLPEKIVNQFVMEIILPKQKELHTGWLIVWTVASFLFVLLVFLYIPSKIFEKTEITLSQYKEISDAIKNYPEIKNTEAYKKIISDGKINYEEYSSLGMENERLEKENQIKNIVKAERK